MPLHSAGAFCIYGMYFFNLLGVFSSRWFGRCGQVGLMDETMQGFK